MDKALRIVVTGRVQGVGFRAALHRKAVGLGLFGWVRNVADGSVEAVVEGKSAEVNALEAWCHQGPPSSRVKSVESFPQAIDKTLKSFEIKRE